MAVRRRVGACSLRAFLVGGVSVLFFRPAVLLSIAVLALGATACDNSSKNAGELRDDFGNTISLADNAPRRIVSLSPATTELVFTLGGGSRLVGRSKYDQSPDSATLVPDLGDGIRPNVEAVLGTRPDLVLLYASQENRPAADRFRAAGINTLSLRTNSIADFRRVTGLLGAILRDTARARTVIDSVQGTLDRVRAATAGATRPTVFWHIWDSPLITIGSGSFMNELVDVAGARNVYADITGASGQIGLEDVARRDPDFILAGPEGARQIRSDSRWRIVRAARDGKIVVVDTTLVGRPSVRLGEAAVFLANALHPGIVR
ncbi:MAG TPA: helical backbone metal receptor [Gemmatimonadaceae bacterium]